MGHVAKLLRIGLSCSLCEKRFHFNRHKLKKRHDVPHNWECILCEDECTISDPMTEINMLREQIGKLQCRLHSAEEKCNN